LKKQDNCFSSPKLLKKYKPILGDKREHDMGIKNRRQFLEESML